MADKKERQRLKRKAAKQQQRRQAGKGPLAGMVVGRGAFTVYRSDEWDDLRQCSVFVLREEAGRKHFAGFLVDRGVAGLKDAWVIPNVPQEQFDGMVRKARNEFKVVRTTIEDARSLVAGAIRYATQWGFRLPRDMEKALRVVDGVGDWRSADVGRFVPEFAGSRRDLQLRCIGQPFEEFMARTDVAFTFDDRAPSLIDEEDAFDAIEDDPDLAKEAREFADIMGRFNDTFVDKVTQWCLRTGQAPHPALADAVNFQFTAAMMAIKDMTGPPDPDKPVLDDATRERLLSAYPLEEQLNLRAALAQLRRFNEEELKAYDDIPSPDAN